MEDTKLYMLPKATCLKSWCYVKGHEPSLQHWERTKAPEGQGRAVFALFFKDLLHLKVSVSRERERDCSTAGSLPK